MQFRNLSIAFVTVFLLTSCGGDGKKTKKRIGASQGRVNTATIVMSNDLWQGAVGDSLREEYAAPVLGLPREEPLFTVKQFTPETINKFYKQSRTLVYASIADSTGASVEHNVYGIPQTVVRYTATDENSLGRLISEKSGKIIEDIKKQELQVRQKQIVKAKKNIDSLRKNFGIKIKFPSIYRYAKQEDNFYWMRKEIKNGDNMNLTVYEVPMSQIKEDSNTIAHIVRMRDSMSGKNIPVEKGRFVTQSDFSPYLKEITLDGKRAWETKGIWEVDIDIMAGPFLNYAIEDPTNNRYLVLEGFISSPSQDQRDNMLELEAILKSVTFDK